MVLSFGLRGLAEALLLRSFVFQQSCKAKDAKGPFTSTSAAVRLIAAKESFKGRYAGYGSFVLRDLPFDAIQFCLYDQLRIGYKAKRELNDLENAIIGAFAGALTEAISTPLDVIKTRLLVQTIVWEEGPPALLKGTGPRVMSIGIGGSIFFGAFERTRRLLAQR